MERIRQSGGTLFVNNACADSMDLLESPLEMYSNIYAIFVTNGEAGKNMIGLRGYKDSLRSIFLMDPFDVIDLESEEFSGLNVKKAGSVREAVLAVANQIGEKRNEDTEEEESTVLISPIFDDRMNDGRYGSQSDEFRKVVESL
jgi:hypothetical protein